MEGMVELDKLSLVVVVDNESDGLSQPCRAADPSAKATERAGERLTLLMTMSTLFERITYDAFWQLRVTEPW
jgi:hypothetical protein